MKTIGMITLVLLIFTQLAAEELIKKDLILFFDNIPPPPATVNEAFSRITVDDGGKEQYNSEKAYGALEKEMKEMENNLAQQMKSASMKAASAGAPASMPDPEMKKKMKQMSPEEKQKFAMEMMKTMPTGLTTPQPESASIQSALSESQKINISLSHEYLQSVEWQQQELQIKKENENAHQEIDRWESAEIAKLPQINYGEMSAPDPAQVKSVKRQANDRHITQADQNLKEIRTLWNKIADHKKTLYTSFYQKLVESDYAVECKNFTTFKLLSDTQMMIIKDLSALIEMSRTACEESAQWLVIRQKIEKE